MFRSLLTAALVLGFAPLLVSFDKGSAQSGDQTEVVITPTDPTDADVVNVATKAVWGNSCLTLRGYRVKLDYEKKTVRVRMKYRTVKGGCFDALFKITEDVSVGPLPVGTWTIDTQYRVNGKKWFTHEEEVVVAASG